MSQETHQIMARGRDFEFREEPSRTEEERRIFIVQIEGRPGGRLRLSMPEPTSVVLGSGYGVTRRDMRQAIGAALDAGWEPEAQGGAMDFMWDPET